MKKIKLKRNMTIGLNFDPLKNASVCIFDEKKNIVEEIKIHNKLQDTDVVDIPFLVSQLTNEQLFKIYPYFSEGERCYYYKKIKKFIISADLIHKTNLNWKEKIFLTDSNKWG